MGTVKVSNPEVGDAALDILLEVRVAVTLGRLESRRGRGCAPDASSHLIQNASVQTGSRTMSLFSSWFQWLAGSVS